MRKLTDIEMRELDKKWKEPLKKHTRLSYDECCMKQKLEFLFPHLFVDLQIKDKPDLQSKDESVGIEVSSAINRVDRQIASLAVDLFHSRTDNLEKTKKDIEELGGRIFQYGISYPEKNTQKDYSDVINIIEEKLNKLNNGTYKRFEYNYLAIDTELFLEGKHYLAESLMKDINNICSNKIKYDSIFVFNPFYVYVFDLKQNRFSSIKCDTHEMTRCAYEARVMVENDEVFP